MAVSKVAQISKLAKKIRKPGEAWTGAIKRASKQISGTVASSRVKRSAPGKRKSVPKKKSSYKPRKKIHQTGSSSVKLDKRVKAKAPGKRKSAAGKTYYEFRKNRTDMPGKLTGTGSAYNEVIMGRMRSNYIQIEQTQTAVRWQKMKKAAVKTKLEKNVYQAKINELNKFIRTLEADNRMLKRLLPK